VADAYATSAVDALGVRGIRQQFALEAAMADEFAGKTALVTGAGRGIGRALAYGLADRGADLLLLASSADELESSRALVTERGLEHGRVIVIMTDLADESHRLRAIDTVLAHGRVDILVNNAATVEPLGITAQIPSADLRQAFELNVFAPMALAAAVTPGMADAGWGRIVNLSSGIAEHPEFMVRGNAYAATKAALETHTRNLAAELRGTGITANVYRPGRVDATVEDYVRSQDPERIGPALYAAFQRFATTSALIAPEASAEALLTRLEGRETGEVWSADDLPSSAS
jgi:NAD(P)-dependent dehydrogenase (short-subunit alcohol dehydrogenase family)